MRSNQTLSMALRRLAAIICLISFYPAASRAELLPADQKTDWTPGVTVGVPGGIPNRTNIVTVSADNSGSSDVSSAIQGAINSAPAGSVVFLPAGTYRIGSDLHLRNNITIRGAGMDVTILNFVGSNPGGAAFAARTNSDGFWDPSSYPIVTSGTTKGSTVLTVADTSSFTVGRMLQVTRFNSSSQFDSPLVTDVWGNGDGHGWGYKQKSKLIAKTSTTLTIFPPLHGDMSGHTVRVVPGGFDGGSIGIEDLTIDMRSGSISFGIFLEEQVGSWIKNVRVRGAANYSVNIMDCLQGEIRDCYLDELNHSGTNGAGLLMGASSGMLVENNIIRNSFPSIEVNSGSSGNVFGYNFCLNDEGGMFAIDTNHGPHNSYNLYEGNITNNIISDGFFGGESHLTIFRNWCTGHVQSNGVRLNRFTRLASVIGNIIGGPTNTFGYSGTQLGQPNIGNGQWSGDAPPWADWGTGPGPGGFQELDHGVAASTIRKGNYNFFDNAIPASESLGGDTLPNSLYLSGKPAWFGNLTWPPINPLAPGDSSSLTKIYERIPAGVRWLSGSNPPPDPPPASSPTPAPGSGGSNPPPAPTPAPSPTPAAGSNLALNKPVTASAPANPFETAPNAVNGTADDKWCSTAAQKWLQVDLGSVYSVNQFVLRHAAAGGEISSWNTRDYNIQVSLDGVSWSTVLTVTGNTLNVTSSSIAPVQARYVKLNVTAAEQIGNLAARIYEFEVYGNAATPPPISAAGSNLALNKPVTASAPANASETAPNAVNGSIDDKWCSRAAAKWLQVDLGSIYSVNQFVLAHAGAGGEISQWNTRDYNIQVSVDGVSWSTVLTVTGNTLSVTSSSIAPVQARYVKLNVTAAEQTGNLAARIYEFEVYGDAISLAPSPPENLRIVSR
jgi:hypothetical protein